MADKNLDGLIANFEKYLPIAHEGFKISPQGGKEIYDYLVKYRELTINKKD